MILAYAGCSTCKNAIAWLKANDVAHVVRPIVEEPPTALELARWIPASGVGVKKWLNTSGLSYRALGKDKVDAATDATLVKWLAADGKLVKRPVLVKGDEVLVGFRSEAYAALLGSVLAALVALGALGCNDDKKTTTAPPPRVIEAPATVSAASLVPPVTAKPSPRFDAAEAALLFGGARKVASTPEDKAKVDALEQVLRTDDAAPRTATKELNADVVAAIKAGKVDMAKLEPRLVALDTERTGRREKEAEAVNGLWAALDPTQRKAVVADARAAEAARARAFEQTKDTSEEAAEQRADWKKHRAERMAKDLDLDAEQAKKVEPLLAKSEDPAAIAAAFADASKKLDPVLTAFEGDAFDAKKLDAFKAPGKKGRGPVEGGIKLMASLVPILKPEQREKLAGTFDEKMMMAGMSHTAASPLGRPRMMRPFGAGGHRGVGRAPGEIDDRP
jgi:arsenate reductase